MKIRLRKYKGAFYLISQNTLKVSSGVKKIVKKKKEIFESFTPFFSECGITIYPAAEVRNVSHPRLVSLPCIFLNIIN